MSFSNSNAFLNQEFVREVNKNIVAELEQRLTIVEKDVIMWTGQQFDFLSHGKRTVGLQLYKIAYCLDVHDFHIKMLSRSFVGLIENITANSNQNKTYVQHLTKQIAALACGAQENSQQLIQILMQRRCDYISHINMNDMEIERLILSNNAGFFDHIYGLIEEKHNLNMLILKLQL